MKLFLDTNVMLDFLGERDPFYISAAKIATLADKRKLIIEKGLNSDFSDFEDLLQYYSALRTECDIIKTRNGKDSKKSQIPVMTPDEFLTSIQS